MTAILVNLVGHNVGRTPKSPIMMKKLMLIKPFEKELRKVISEPEFLNWAKFFK